MDSNEWFHHAQEAIDAIAKPAYDRWRSSVRDIGHYGSERAEQMMARERERAQRAAIRELNERHLLMIAATHASKAS